MSQREARYKLVAINHYWVLDVLRSWSDPAQYLRLPRIAGIPDGAEIEDVHDDWRSKQFILRLWHPSFDIVPDGEQIPFLSELPLQVDLVQLRRSSEDGDLPTFVVPG